MKKFILFYVPSVFAALLSICFFFESLLTVIDIPIDGINDANIPALYLLAISACILMPLSAIVICDVTLLIMKNMYFKRCGLKKRLLEYMNEVISANPELKQYVRYVKIHVSNDENMYQGGASFKHQISISYNWLILANSTTEGFEMLKTTLCHEIAHLYVHNTYSRKEYVASFFRSYSVDALKRSWLNEFTADYNGRCYYERTGGDVKYFIQKCEMLRNYPSGVKTNGKWNNHPTWDMRIELLRNNICPTKELSDELFTSYQDSLKNRKKLQS